MVRLRQVSTARIRVTERAGAARYRQQQRRRRRRPGQGSREVHDGTARVTGEALREIPRPRTFPPLERRARRAGVTKLAATVAHA
jgi:hypothetical protein